MDQLNHLGKCRAGPTREELRHVSTSLIIGQWANHLSKHPDQRLTHFLLEGLKKGFRIGFDHTQMKLKKAGANLLSASVSSYIKDEVALGRLAGPLSPQVAAQIHTSPIWVIPKGHTPGRWRLIVDLSSPAGGSINDGINQTWCSLSYISVDDVHQDGCKDGKRNTARENGYQECLSHCASTARGPVVAGTEMAG